MNIDYEGQKYPIEVHSNTLVYEIIQEFRQALQIQEQCNLHLENQQVLQLNLTLEDQNFKQDSILFLKPIQNVNYNAQQQPSLQTNQAFKAQEIIIMFSFQGQNHSLSLMNDTLVKDLILCIQQNFNLNEKFQLSLENKYTLNEEQTLAAQKVEKGNTLYPVFNQKPQQQQFEENYTLILNYQNCKYQFEVSSDSLGSELMDAIQQHTKIPTAFNAIIEGKTPLILDKTLKAQNIKNGSIIEPQVQPQINQLNQTQQNQFQKIPPSQQQNFYGTSYQLPPPPNQQFIPQQNQFQFNQPMNFASVPPLQQNTLSGGQKNLQQQFQQGLNNSLNQLNSFEGQPTQFLPYGKPQFQQQQFGRLSTQFQKPQQQQMGGMPYQQQTFNQPQIGGMPNQQQIFNQPQIGGMPNQQQNFNQPQIGGMPNQQQIFNLPQMGGMPYQQQTFNQPQIGGMPNQQQIFTQPQMGGIPNQQQIFSQPQNNQKIKIQLRYMNSIEKLESTNKMKIQDIIAHCKDVFNIEQDLTIQLQGQDLNPQQIIEQCKLNDNQILDVVVKQLDQLVLNITVLGNDIQVEVDQDQKVFELIDELKMVYNINYPTELVFNQIQLLPDKSFKQQNILSNSYLILRQKQAVTKLKITQSLNLIIVKVRDGMNMIQIEIAPTATVQDLERKVKEKTGINFNFTLQFNMKFLSPYLSLAQQGINNNCEVILLR
ncbi:unnamed protein product [Paramecium primaurelia]|uniref:Ubiquitin-like domain-containing protein n=1 Tax=Paramecium primaurelia TaxID=5886 RepID=A0A8S1M2I7_PARPR|nr:unnamed protein product [Paramecium primaurelia]